MYIIYHKFYIAYVKCYTVQDLLIFCSESRMTFCKMYKPFWGGVAISYRVTLNFGTPYYCYGHSSLYRYSMLRLPAVSLAFSHKETGLGFSAEQRVLL